MLHSSTQFTLFCLVLMMSTLGYAMMRIVKAKRRGEQIPESSASWAILSSFVICGLAFAQVVFEASTPSDQNELSGHSPIQVEQIKEVVQLGQK
ncbi:Hypothetical protein HDN1F_17040 [gamma proteobacterium HdN1]|nr:Hypothetical protein HDN1F_17040 [gamma proteobacterium HdN1]